MLSSSVNSIGKSFTCLRNTASGIFGPCAARARMNTVSFGDALPANAELNATLPVIAAAGLAAAGLTAATACWGASLNGNCHYFFCPPRAGEKKRAGALDADFDPLCIRGARMQKAVKLLPICKRH